VKICFVTSEIAPFSKSGGMGDVCRALADALAARGHEVVTVSPRYASVPLDDLSFTGTVFDVPGGAHGLRVGIHEVTRHGVRHLFVDHAVFHRGGLYGDEHGAFGDNHLRFAALSRAALEAAHRVVGWSDEEVLFHAHDWQTALVPVLLDAVYRPVGRFERAASVLTLHNPAHQGRLPARLFHDLDLSSRWFGPATLEFYGDLGLLKGGILWADQLTTVSPTFARDIVQPGGGFGLEGVIALRSDVLTGILNGVDVSEWNPADDPAIEAPFTAESLEGKARCKAALQVELGLPADPSVPLVGSVGRLDPQKGVELLVDSIPWLVSEGAQVVVLGSAAAAHRRYEGQLRALEKAHPHHVRAWIGFQEGLAHRIEAGADLFAMPSMFEPCGLNQLYSMRYGTVPVVRRTGGLADSVQEVDAAAATGTGFLFDVPHGKALRDALYRGLHLFRTDPEAFDEVRRRGMRRDSSWGPAVDAYLEVYRAAFEGRGPTG
jgi:starch synthase